MRESMEEPKQFESRKQDHIRLALEDSNEAIGFAGFSQLELLHNALPELNFSEVSISTKIFNEKAKTPFLVSSMTAGHVDSMNLNIRLAQACEARGWMMGVGSQRRELGDDTAKQEWVKVREAAPNVRLLGNLGLAQIIDTPIDKISRLVESLEGTALIIHLNSLQEVMQPEGTPFFKGGLAAIKNVVKSISVPVIVKETGCGFSKSTILQLKDAGVAAIDVSGFGGTHWGRIEGGRNREDSRYQRLSSTFSNWGISTVQSLLNAKELNGACEIWASGGVRNGLQAAKCLALGANVVGFAKPVLKAALQGEQALNEMMELTELELRTALFCTGSPSISELQQNKEVVVWQNQ